MGRWPVSFVVVMGVVETDAQCGRITSDKKILFFLWPTPLVRTAYPHPRTLFIRLQHRFEKLSATFLEICSSICGRAEGSRRRNSPGYPGFPPRPVWTTSHSAMGSLQAILVIQHLPDPSVHVKNSPLSAEQQRLRLHAYVRRIDCRSISVGTCRPNVMCSPFSARVALR